MFADRRQQAEAQFLSLLTSWLTSLPADGWEGTSHDLGDVLFAFAKWRKLTAYVFAHARASDAPTADEVAINAFSSLRRDRVFMHECKAFDEKMGPRVEARIAGLKPGHFTRLGPAIRHASKVLAEREFQRRLLIVITDGKPNDLDHYEGRHGIEDTHMAVREARRSGQTVFGVTIDTKSQAAFARIFGRHGFAVISHPDKLTASLPQLYRHLISA